LKPDAELKRFGILPNTRRDGGLELWLRGFLQFFRAILNEARSGVNMRWGERMQAWRLGFNSVSWKIYDLPENDPSQYLPDFPAIVKGYRINGFFNSIISNKLILSRLLAAHQVPHPAVVSVVLGGKLYEEDAAFEADMSAVLSRTLERYPSQVFRPTWTGSGQGVFFLRKEDGRLALNNQEISLEEVCTLVSQLDRYMATEFLQQDTYAQEVYPDTANTIRILTLWDLDLGEPYVAGIVHRFGTADSGLLDTWNRGAGGLCAAIDQATGRLGKAVQRSRDNRMIWHSVHPDSGAVIEGLRVPELGRYIQGTLKTAARLPYCPMIGWDVLPTQEGFSILEANTQPGIALMQVHKPLLEDRRTKRFFQHWGLVRKETENG